MRTWAASLRGGRPAETVERAKRLLDAGFHHLVLHPPLAAASWAACAQLLPPDTIVATALFLPYPKDIQPGATAAFSLDAANRDERGRFLDVAAESIRFADARRARTVILPVTPLEEPRPSRDASRVGDAYRFALDRLLPIAAGYDITLCLVPSSRTLEFPHLEELRTLRVEFAGGDLATWFDSARLRTPVDPCDDDDVRGLSIHDARGDANGLLPGRGDVDWPGLDPAVDAAPVWDLHLRPDAPAEEWARALEYFERRETGPTPSFGLFTF